MTPAKVRPKAIYVYDPGLVDRCDGRTLLNKGELVRVVRIVYPLPITADVPEEVENLRGSTERCYVETLDGKTVSLVACDSLVSRRSERAKQILAELKSQVSKML